MKVCDVVLNSIWYDPRVRKQISAYIDRNVELSCVGMRCARYDEDKIRSIPCKTNIVQIDQKLDGKQKSIVKKIQREFARFRGVRNAIIAENPDIIHANDLNALIPAFAAKRKLKCRLIYDSHEVYIENYTISGKSRIAFFMKLMEKFLIRHSDLMVCVSNAAASYFEEEYGILRPTVVTNCSLKKEMEVLPGELKNPGFEVLNHGQFYEGRGYDVMVKSCGLLASTPDVKLAVRGFGRMESKLHDMVSKLANPEQFIFYQPVHVEQLISFAAKSHVGVAITEPICLNFKLSVSNKLFEYTAAGLPVIMSNIPEHQFLNEKYHFGIVLKDNSPECFAQAVLKLYSDRTFYDLCAKNAAKMSEEINWENEFDKLYILEKKML